MPVMFPLLVSTVALFIVLIAVAIRLIKLLRRHAPHQRHLATSARVLIVLGSGGHTAELLAALRDLDTTKYMHRSYLVSSGDAFSALKAKEFEHGLKDIARSRDKLIASNSMPCTFRGSYGSFDIVIVPRARKIHQSILTTPFSSLSCLFACFSVLGTPSHDLENPQIRSGFIYPDLILSNGPATAVIVIIASLILRFLAIPGTQHKMRTVYIESWARVKKLSLSGKILIHIVDRFLVQWEALLVATNGKGEYLGVLV